MLCVRSMYWLMRAEGLIFWRLPSISGEATNFQRYKSAGALWLNTIRLYGAAMFGLEGPVIAY